MLVDLSRITDGVVRLKRSNERGVSCENFEGRSGDDNVRGVGSARPFLAIDAVAEGCGGGFAWRKKGQAVTLNLLGTSGGDPKIKRHRDPLKLTYR